MGELLYSTGSGHAWVGDAVTALRDVCEPDSVDLIMTSPPFLEAMDPREVRPEADLVIRPR
jgi:hypothetical protein